MTEPLRSLCGVLEKPTYWVTLAGKTPLSPQSHFSAVVPTELCWRRGAAAPLFLSLSVETLASVLVPVTVGYQAYYDEHETAQHGEEHGEEDGYTTHPFLTHQTSWNRRERTLDGEGGLEGKTASNALPDRAWKENKGHCD